MNEFLSMAELEAIEMEDERGGELGDPRRCPTHGEVTSTPDGMFDLLCGACEDGMNEEAEYEAVARQTGPTVYEQEARAQAEYERTHAAAANFGMGGVEVEEDILF